MTAWRLLYNIPPCDPRLALITHEEVRYDLLVRVYNVRMHREQSNPTEVANEDLRSDGVKQREMEEAALAFAHLPQTLAALQALRGGGRTDEAPSPPVIRAGGLTVVSKE